MTVVLSSGIVVPQATKRGCLIVEPAGNTTATQAIDSCQRVLVRLPVRTTRWRVRVANLNNLGNARYSNVPGITGVYLGSPTYTDSDNRWAGAAAATMASVAGSAASHSDGTDVAASWVTDSASQFTPGVERVVSVGLTATSIEHAYALGDGGFLADGSGASAGAAAAGNPGGVSMQGAIRTCVFVDYEYETTATGGVPVILVLGNSITAGYSPQTVMAKHETWVGAAAARNGFVPVNFGVGGSTLAGWADSGSVMWTRADLTGAGLPDGAIISLGSNDIANSGVTNVSTLLASLASVIANVRARGISRIWLGTMIPRNMSGASETARVGFNNAIRKLPFGVEGVFDFDKAVYSQATPATADVDYYDAGQPHPYAAGYQKMASAIQMPVLA